MLTSKTNFLVSSQFFSADVLRPGKSDNNDQHDEGSRADLVPQDPPGGRIKAPSREVPTVWRAAQIRFGLVDTGYDL